MTYLLFFFIFGFGHWHWHPKFQLLNVVKYASFFDICWSYLNKREILYSLGVGGFPNPFKLISTYIEKDISKV